MKRPSNQLSSDTARGQYAWAKFFICNAPFLLQVNNSENPSLCVN